jgi:hypothetical protein
MSAAAYKARSKNCGGKCANGLTLKESRGNTYLSRRPSLRSLGLGRDTDSLEFLREDRPDCEILQAAAGRGKSCR